LGGRAFEDVRTEAQKGLFQEADWKRDLCGFYDRRKRWQFFVLSWRFVFFFIFK